ncbi:S8 family serine peptidase [Taibaiella chishuiensis]|uniref:Putative secreted protein (Por secretion system target) n=1 Tax=Taibaiella chishuiensis TaxID=1434707 RepID=A0A2P8CWD7_9BACT|nr:S8 family serine peptidase [Taibaiella chishuiensis]PSK89288.1 putative secreted protein (Por secretion system target) [Taibaiella chishuiensis]
MKQIFTIVLLLWSGLAARAQLAKAPAQLALANRDIALQAGLGGLEEKVRSMPKTEAGTILYLQFHMPPDRGKLQDAGIILQDYVQHNTYTAFCTPQAQVARLQQFAVTAWAPMQADDKLNMLLRDPAGQEAQQVLLVSVVKPSGAAALNAALPGLGGRLSVEQPWSKQDLWQVEMPYARIRELAAAGFVRYINPKMIPQPMNTEAEAFTNTAVARQPIALGGHNLHGEGVIMGVGDDSNPTHIDVIDRLRGFNPLVSSDHGFHTATTVVGGGLKDEYFKGFAPRSNVISDYFSQIISNAATYRSDFDMVVSNNSYGNILKNCAYAGTYDAYSQFTDQLMRDVPDMLHVFASANDGNMTCTPYPTGYATVTGSFSTAKNVLTVGAVGKSRELLSSYTSRGPVKDGRMKPEITAVGSALFSGIQNNNYGPGYGTSMACPNVTGAAGLLYQRYRQLHGNQNPANVLIKTLLMNGASDLATPGPDYAYGFGLLDLGRSLTMLDSNRYFSNTINTTQEQTYTVTVPPNTAQARFMICWNDPAVAPLTVSTLVNDLDLAVVTPAAATVLPWILDATPSAVTAPAVRGFDRVNNVEQVTIDNPAAGNYTLKVKGFNVPEPNQQYVVAYDFQKVGITLQYPFGGESLVAGDSMIVYWDASPGSNTFALSFSADNGASWTPVNASIPANQRLYTWYPPAGLASDQCLVRLSRNGTTQQEQSKAFILAGRPAAVLNPVAEQCPGSVKLSWAPVTGVSNYQVYLKQGSEMLAVAALTGNTYTFKNLSHDSTYWVAVAPLVNGKPGMRSVALSRQPADGSCTGLTPHGDLSLEAITGPQSGRELTSTSLTIAANRMLRVRVGNYDGQNAADYRIAYQLDNAAWVSQAFTDVINAGGTRVLDIADLGALAVTGNHTLKVAVVNQALTDPVPGNDTQVVVIKQLANPAIGLGGGYTEDFENAAGLDIMGKGMIGIDGADRWDFTQTKPFGRIRSFVNSDISIQGNRSLSMDNNNNQRFDIAGSSFNTATGTFNLAGYNPAGWEVRCEFDYIMHGVPKFDTGNQAWVRGSDTDPWIPLYAYQIDTTNLGVVRNSGSLSLTDILLAAGQTFSSSTQIRFGQYDTSLIAATYFGNGFTMDNFKLYTVTDDVSLLSIDSVYHYNCALSSTLPVRVSVVNGVNYTIHNIAVSYKIGNLPAVTEMIDSIAGKDTLSYTFIQTADLSATTTFDVSAWVNVPTDTYHLNDSLMHVQVINQPMIAAFPYLENFEQDNGFYFTEGVKSSWAYGTPASPRISHAASGSKAWKTNLRGNYNSVERSYLYSPCFDISSLANPTLSFHLATDLEGATDTSYFDIAYVEYSNNGYTWNRLGAAGQGTNWYNSTFAGGWAKEGETYWHVATIGLPKTGNTISFRFVLVSDPGKELEGIAIDDIHIYDLQRPIFDQEAFPAAISQNAGPAQVLDFTSGNAIGLNLRNGASTLGSVTVQAYKHTDYINDDSTQYFLPKNFTVQTANAPGDSVTLRFFVPDQAMRTVREDQVCYSCSSRPVEVQQLGITKYDDPDKQKENNTLADNTGGTYSFITRDKIRWVPYDIGYYAEVKVKSFSEFWFNDGGPNHDQVLSSNLFDFTASHYGKRHALLQWSSQLDGQTVKYDIERADPSMNFEKIATVNSVAQNGHAYSYIDTPSIVAPVVFYRLQYQLQDGSLLYSLVRRLDFSEVGGTVNIYPNPVRNGVLNIEWFKGNSEAIDWRLSNVSGQTINVGRIEYDLYNGHYTLDLNQFGLSAGVYLLKLNSGREHWEFKVVYYH